MGTVTTPVHNFQLFPFISSGGPDGRPRHFWCVKEPKSWIEANALGELYADMVIDHMKFHNLEPLLGWVMCDMIAEGRWGGVEIGFAGRIAERLMR